MSIRNKHVSIMRIKILLNQQTYCLALTKISLIIRTLYILRSWINGQEALVQISKCIIIVSKINKKYYGYILNKCCKGKLIYNVSVIIYHHTMLIEFTSPHCLTNVAKMCLFN